MTETYDAETALIGSILGTSGQVLDEIPRLSADDFGNPILGELFEQSKKIYAESRPVDLVTLSDAVPARLRSHVIECAKWSHETYNADEHARIVEKHGVRRRLADVGMQIAALDPSLSSSQMIDQAQALLGKVVDRSVKPAYRFVGDLLDEVLVNVVEDATYFPTPWKRLSRAIGGFRPGAVYVVAARPGVGKTVVAAQIATELAKHGAVAFSSLEMSAQELVQRFISERAQVHVGHLKNNQLTDHDLGKINSRREALVKLNIAIDDRTSITPGDVRAFVRGLSKRHDVSGVVVDYLQLMSSDSKFERYAQVTEFSRQMKILAKDFNIPVIVLSQLNRQSESRIDGKPRISDLRESGAIEQDADVVMLLRREGEQPEEFLIIDVAKNRHGETGEVDLEWQGYWSRAVDWEGVRNVGAD